MILKMSLTHKTILGFIFLIVLLAGVNIYGTSYVLENLQEERLKTSEVVFAKSLSKRIYRAVIEGDIHYITDILFDEKNLRSEKIEYILVFDMKWHLLAHTYLNEFPKALLQHRSLKPGEEYLLTQIQGEGLSVYDIYVPVMEGIKQVGMIHLGIKADYIQNIITPTKSASNMTILLTLIISAIAAVFAIPVSRTITRPVMKLKKLAEKISNGELDTAIDIQSGDEIGALAKAFSQMTENLRNTTVSKDYMDNILHSMNDCLIVLSPDGTIQIVNTAVLNLLEYREEELIDQPIEKIFSRDIQMQEHDSPSAIRDHAIINEECRLITKNGHLMPVIFSSSFMQDKKGDIQGIVCVAQDISDRKWIEEALMASEDYFRSFVENSQDSMYNISVDGTIMSINPAASKLNDINAAEEMVGTKYTAHVIGDKTSVENAIVQASTGSNAAIEYKTLSKKGREVWWDAKFTPVKDLDGSIKSISIVARDMTKNKEMEEELRQAQELLMREHNKLIDLFKEVEEGKKVWENTMDCMGDMIIIADNDGKIRRYNKPLREFTTKTDEELLGRNWEDLMHEIELETVTFYAGSIELLHKPTHRWFTLNSSLFKEDSKEHSGTVITIHETTEAKKITEELEKAYSELKASQSAVLQREKMASIGQLAAGVAHEINNPMGFITSNLGTLGKYTKKLTEFINDQTALCTSVQKDELMETLQEKRKKLKVDYILDDLDALITESLDGAERVKRIVQNLKTFSRVDESEYKDADINECIESTLNIVWNELKYKATMHKEYQSLPPVKCYPQQLNQVFMNLLVNAAHSIEKQGEITIKTWNGNGFINISISDTGCGIPAENVDKIFEPFFTTKEVGKGTGLGLSISYEIIKKHKGDIMIKSEIGKGTDFTIRIPLVEDNSDE